MLKMLDLFSGIGGFSLAAHWTHEIETVAFCEINPYATKVLNKNFQDIPVNPDITKLRNEGQYGTIDIICGGFPCQPFSVAGKRKGTSDNRDLWPEMFRVINEFKPSWVIGENVANFVNMELERTVSDLENQGYKTQTFIIPACAVDAKHERKRCWIVAHSGRELRERCEQSRENAEKIERGITDQFKRSSEILANSESKQGRWLFEQGIQSNIGAESKNVLANADNERSQGRIGTELQKQAGLLNVSIWQPEPPVGRVANGIPSRVDRLKCLGNAIVPQVVYSIFKAIVDIENVDVQYQIYDAVKDFKKINLKGGNDE